MVTAKSAIAASTTTGVTAAGPVKEPDVTTSGTLSADSISAAIPFGVSIAVGSVKSASVSPGTPAPTATATTIKPVATVASVLDVKESDGAAATASGVTLAEDTAGLGTQNVGSGSTSTSTTGSTQDTSTPAAPSKVTTSTIAGFALLVLAAAAIIYAFVKK